MVEAVEGADDARVRRSAAYAEIGRADVDLLRASSRVQRAVRGMCCARGRQQRGTGACGMWR